MKKLSIVLGSLIISGMAYSAQLELKAGVEPWREGKNSYADFDMGGSLGAELLFNAENRPFDYGVGFEWKSKFEGDSKSSNGLASSKANAFPLYVTGKYGINDNLFYLVGRAGWAMYDESAAKDGFYGAVGVGKQFGAITVETLYETMDLGNSSKLYSGEQANLVSIKLGYRIGENKRDKMAREAEEAARFEYEKQQAEAVALAAEAELLAAQELEAQELEAARLEEARLATIAKYTSPLVVANYETNNVEAEQMNEELLKNMKTDLQDEAGVVEVKVYTDSLGSKTYNQTISQERADKLSEKVTEVLANENIEVKAVGLGEENFLNDNATSEERFENRRAEINFIVE